MRILLCIGVLLFAIGFYFPANAQPPLWQDNFGDEIVGLTGCDDCNEPINFPFPIPFNGGSFFNMAYVGTNGCIQLGGLGLDDDIDYDY